LDLYFFPTRSIRDWQKGPGQAKPAKKGKRASMSQGKGRSGSVSMSSSLSSDSLANEDDDEAAQPSGEEDVEEDGDGEDDFGDDADFEEKGEPADENTIAKKKYIQARASQGVSSKQLKGALEATSVTQHAAKFIAVILDSFFDPMKNWDLKGDPTGAKTFGDLRQYNALLHAIM
jgi:hypothetical protein